MTLGMDGIGCQSAPCHKVLGPAQPEVTSSSVDSYQNSAAVEVTLDGSSYNEEIDGQIN